MFNLENNKLVLKLVISVSYTEYIMFAIIVWISNIGIYPSIQSGPYPFWAWCPSSDMAQSPRTRLVYCDTIKTTYPKNQPHSFLVQAELA